MFEEIFFPRTAERYRAAPLVEQRERYLVHLRETGARRTTLRKCANDQLSLVRQVRPVGVTQGENTLCRSRNPMAALLGMARRTRI